MMLTNTNNLEVLFQDLCNEDIASISGGQSISLTASAKISQDGNSASASISQDGNSVTATAQGSTIKTSTDPKSGTGFPFSNPLSGSISTISVNPVSVFPFTN